MPDNTKRPPEDDEKNPHEGSSQSKGKLETQGSEKKDPSKLRVPPSSTDKPRTGV